MSVWETRELPSKFWGKVLAGRERDLTRDRFKQIAGLVKETSKDTKRVMETLLSKM